MADHNDFGASGEELAAGWLVKQGFELIDRNWRFRKAEIDIICKRNNIPHFVEVKSRSSNNFGFPETGVTPKKIRMLLQGINEWMYIHPEYKNFQLDILSITTRHGQEAEFFLIEDVYL
jgi:putative endonuclease